MPLHPYVASFLLIFPLLVCAGCEKADRVTQAQSGGTPAAPKVEPQLTVAPGFSYDEDEPWTIVTEETAEGTYGQTALRVLEAELEIGVVILSDNVRIYNIGRGWVPMTLTLIDEEDNPLETFRIDLPPRGVVRATPLMDSEKVAKLRLTEPRIVAEGKDSKPNLLDRQIGTPAKEFTTASVKDLGFATVEKLASTSQAESDIQVTATKTESGLTSQSLQNPTTTWKSIVLADRFSSLVAHQGNDGQSPPESWWVSTINDVLPQSE